MNTKSICEWGHIVRETNEQGTNANEKHTISISQKAWEELEKSADGTDKYIDFKNSTTLRIKNYVGVITTQDGTQIEILPKIYEQNLNAENTLEKSRTLLWKMLGVVQKIKGIKTTEAHLRTKKQPLLEALITRFLDELKVVVKRGIRSDYHRTSAHEKFLRGQLQLQKQINEPPHRHHLFHIEYDIFSPNRAENRLIHAALIQVGRWSKGLQNKEDGRRLLSLFNEVPISQNYPQDFLKWQKSDRHMQHYQPLLPWLKLILNQQNPFALKDKNAGISFLFPMETLFEEYVAEMLKRSLPDGCTLNTQDTIHCLSQSPKKFKLRPDIVITKENKPPLVLDTKWKIPTTTNDKLDEQDNPDKHIQSDVYQLFAYGKKYKAKQVSLIYPSLSNQTESKFQLDDDLTLNVLHFNLNDETEENPTLQWRLYTENKH